MATKRICLTMIAGPDLANEIVQTKKLFYDSPKTEMFRALILKGL